MEQYLYEIWVHRESQKWKVFTAMSEDFRNTLIQTGWKPAVQYKISEEESNRKKNDLEGEHE
jgi:hypothetical protein